MVAKCLWRVSVRLKSLIFKSNGSKWQKGNASLRWQRDRELEVHLESLCFRRLPLQGLQRPVDSRLRRHITKGQRAISMLNPDQIRAARALLRWSARELAARSSVHLTTIQRMEGQHGVLRGRIATLQKVQAALEAAGVEFTEPKRGGSSVRLQAQGRGDRRLSPRKAMHP